ncbi:hypothetical protein [Streptomyces showdoensis]|uniref:hypothetical protein n=1 Tax=Streptomyces showdoensis TaxID=68268 RepID=UPI0013F4D875|nr:hypothetical protein [Streptomyces showdoensis]
MQKVFRITWAQQGQDERKVSVVSYSEKAAETYKARKAAEDGVSDVEVVEVKPGE